MSQPAASAAVPDELQQAPLATPNIQTTSDALPMLTSLPDSQAASGQLSSSMSLQPQAALGTPLASHSIKPPPSSGSLAHIQAGTPLWQMLGSAANLPAGMFTGKESLDLDVLAKAAVEKRRQQVQHAGLSSVRFSQLCIVINQAPARHVWRQSAALTGTGLASLRHAKPLCSASHS